MINVLKTLTLSAVILIASGPVVGDEAHESGMAYKFDLDKDGVITRAEFDEAFEKKMQNKLEWLDVNKDGAISPDEFRSQHQAEYDQRWSKWDTDGDDKVSVEAVLQQKQEARAKEKKAQQD